jgi:hypothetical protein
MNLLLLLSALLSALTGVAGSRASVAPQTVSASLIQAAAPRVAAARTMRPVQALPRLAALFVMTRPAFTLVAAHPLFASRRRE